MVCILQLKECCSFRLGLPRIYILETVKQFFSVFFTFDDHLELQVSSSLYNRSFVCNISDTVWYIYIYHIYIIYIQLPKMFLLHYWVGVCWGDIQVHGGGDSTSWFRWIMRLTGDIVPPMLGDVVWTELERSSQHFMNFEVGETHWTIWVGVVCACVRVSSQWKQRKNSI